MTFSLPNFLRDKLPTSTAVNPLESDMNNIYSIDQSISIWKSQPYVIRSEIAGEVVEFPLPINPSNISITTHFANNLVIAMYGQIEEHSKQRLFDITISGTTGVSPKYVNPTNVNTINSYASSNNAQREIAPVDYTVVGFGQRYTELVRRASENAAGIANIFLETKENNFVTAPNSGYMAFHNLYRFLLLYKNKIMNADIQSLNRSNAMDLSSVGVDSTTSTPLNFICVKDKTMYSVIIKNFTLTRSAENPMLYNYTINMRGYNLRSSTLIAAQQSKALEETLGLGGVRQSFMAQFANGMRSIKNTVYSALALARSLQ